MRNMDAAHFRDDDGQRWHVQILWGRPSPTELGIHAAIFRAEHDPEGDGLLGYVEHVWLEGPDEASLRLALHDAEPGTPA